MVGMVVVVKSENVGWAGGGSGDGGCRVRAHNPTHTHCTGLPQPLSQCGGELSARETRAPPFYPFLCVVVVFVVAWVLLCRSV